MRLTSASGEPASARSILLIGIRSVPFPSSSRSITPPRTRDPKIGTGEFVRAGTRLEFSIEG